MCTSCATFKLFDPFQAEVSTSKNQLSLYMVLSFAACKVIVKTLKEVGFSYFICFSVVTELVEDRIFYHQKVFNCYRFVFSLFG